MQRFLALIILNGGFHKRVGILERLNYVNKIFRNSETPYELISSGAYFAYVKHPFREKSSKEVAKQLAEKENILCLPDLFWTEPGTIFENCVCKRNCGRTITSTERLESSLRSLTPG